MTKKQKQDAERARTLLQNQNIIVPQPVAGDGEKPKKPYYGKKKPVKKNAETSETTVGKPSAGVATKSAEPEGKTEEDAKEEEDEEEEVMDDWEKIAEQDFTERKSPEETRNATPLTDKLSGLEVKEAAEEDQSGEIAQQVE